MRPLILLSLGALFTSCLASNYVVHERRHEHTDQRWSKVAQLDGNHVLPIRIGLKQSNLEHADRWLMEVSDPESPRFGQHWTAKEVVDAFKPRYFTAIMLLLS